MLTLTSCKVPGPTGLYQYQDRNIYTKRVRLEQDGAFDYHALSLFMGPDRESSGTWVAANGTILMNSKEKVYFETIEYPEPEYSLDSGTRINLSRQNSSHLGLMAKVYANKTYLLFDTRGLAMRPWPGKVLDSIRIVIYFGAYRGDTIEYTYRLKKSGESAGRYSDPWPSSPSGRL